MRVAVLAIVAALSIAAVPGPVCAAVARDGQVVMGTVLTVTVVARDAETASSLAKAAIEEVRRWDDALTIWRATGELAQLNARAGQGPVRIGSRLAHGLESMFRMAVNTDGAFEPAVATLPDAGDARATLRSIRDALRIVPLPETGGAVATLDARTRLDPGAIGKGLALDSAMKILESGGATAAFLDFGGSSQSAIGAPPGNPDGWPVVVAALAAGEAHTTVVLRDTSLSTSRSAATDTKPILDPRTKLPVAAGRLVTVLAKSATAADAWSTALVVLGRAGQGKATASGLEILIEDAGGLVATGPFAGAGLYPGGLAHAGSD